MRSPVYNRVIFRAACSAQLIRSSAEGKLSARPRATRSAPQEIADELSEKHRMFRKYRRQSLLLMVPLVVPILASVQRHSWAPVTRQEVAAATLVDALEPDAESRGTSQRSPIRFPAQR